MGKIVSNFFISLDGVVESPDKWHFPYFNDEMGANGLLNELALMVHPIVVGRGQRLFEARQPTRSNSCTTRRSRPAC